LGRVRILSEETVRLIAAGEVVSGPASVVKELLENSLDAGAKRVTVNLEAGGREKITVTDDGEGILPEDLPLVFHRHATSKIGSFSDLSRVLTLGFRGEGLASIAAVARVERRRRPAGEAVGWRLAAACGAGGEAEPSGAARGTTVTVSELFARLPARRKSLGSARGELRRVTGVVTALALAWPEVAFALFQDGREVLRTPGTGRMEDALAALWPEVAPLLLRAEEEGVEVFATPGTVWYPSPAKTLLVINRRPVEHRILLRALRQGYHGIIPEDAFPAAVVRLSLPPERVDHNVSPTKHTVRLEEEEEVAERIASLLQRMVGRGTGDMANRAAESASPYQAGLPLGGGLRAVGLLARTYILAEGEESLWVVDQHAAQERVFFERFLRAGEGDGWIQPLALPLEVSFSPEEAEFLESCLPALREIGVEVEPFGRHTFIVRAAPLLPGEDPVRVLRRFVSLREEAGLRLRWARAALAACREAVKAGEGISLSEAQTLLDRLLQCQNPHLCPHGRPVFVRYSLESLERALGRR
jgi:DNA mismatch repair protein MutL